MAISSRVVQDSRTISRIGTRVSCQLAQGTTKCEATVLNLSMGGAFLSSKYLPVIGSTVTLKLKTPASKDDLKLEGKVLRGTWVMSDHGKLGRFAIRFNRNSLDLIKLITALEKQGGTTRL